MQDRQEAAGWTGAGQWGVHDDGEREIKKERNYRKRQMKAIRKSENGNRIRASESERNFEGNASSKLKLGLTTSNRPKDLALCQRKLHRIAYMGLWKCFVGKIALKIWRREQSKVNRVKNNYELLSKKFHTIKEQKKIKLKKRINSVLHLSIFRITEND